MTDSDKADDAQGKALVVFAGAEPRVAAATIAHHAGSIEAIYIHHAKGQEDKAERLRRFCARQWPRTAAVVSCEPGTDTPMSVAGRLRDWNVMRKASWIYDMSGATPPMLAGVSRVACETGARVIGVENADCIWREYEPASGGRLIPMDEPGDLPRIGDADGSDMPAYLEFVATRDAEVIWHGSRPPVRLAPSELSSIARECASNNWSWRESFAKVMGRSAPMVWDFEDMLASILQAIGVANVRVSVGVSIKGAKVAERRFDVIAIHDGEVWAFDCGADADQPDDVRPWRVFGQRIVAIRPARRATPTETRLTSRKRILLDSTDCRSIFDCLSSMLSVRLPREFDALERKSLSREATSDLPVFSPSSKALQFSEAMHIGDDIYDLSAGAAIDDGPKAAPWFAAKLSRTLWSISGSLSKQVTPTEGRGRLAATLQRGKAGAEIVMFDLADNRVEWTAVVRAASSGQFAKWLAKWRNLPLFT